jgi:hypothetical protein
VTAKANGNGCNQSISSAPRFVGSFSISILYLHSFQYMLYVTFASGPDRGSPPKKELNIEDMKHETLMNFASRAEGQFAQFEVRTWTLFLPLLAPEEEHQVTSF